MTSRMIIVHGRANGPIFWTWLLGLYAAEAVCNFTIHGPFPLSQFLYPLICVPRLHDVGRSGWWAFGAAVAGIALGTLASVYLSPTNARHARGAIVLVELILLVILASCDPGRFVRTIRGEQVRRSAVERHCEPVRTPTGPGI